MDKRERKELYNKIANLYDKIYKRDPLNPYAPDYSKERETFDFFSSDNITSERQHIYNKTFGKPKDTKRSTSNWLILLGVTFCGILLCGLAYGLSGILH